MTVMTALALTATILFWGSSFVATKILLEVFPSWAYMFIRFALASVLFLILLITRKELKISAKNAGKIFILAFFEPGLYFLFETLGLERTSAASVAIIIAVVPAAVAFFSGLILKEKLGARGWIGVALSMAGVAWITLFSASQEGGNFAGNLFTLLAVASAVVYIMLTRVLTRSISVVQITAYQIFFSAIMFSPGIMFQYREMAAAVWTPEIIFAFAFMVVGSTFGAFLSYNWALSRIPAAKAAVFINGIPVVTAAVAWILLGEGLTFVQASGGLLTIIGLMIANRQEKPPVPEG